MAKLFGNSLLTPDSYTEVLRKKYDNLKLERPKAVFPLLSITIRNGSDEKSKTGSEMLTALLRRFLHKTKL